MHQGLDYRVGPGTPVAAVNSGTVILAQPLYFEGNCVVLDHGQGLLSLYLHLSEIKVKEVRVARGSYWLERSYGARRGRICILPCAGRGCNESAARLRLPESQAENLAPAHSRAGA